MHTSAFRSSDFSDPFGRYYTGSVIGGLLVSQMTVRRPEVVLDLGAGDGALCRAALLKWRGVRVLAVDSDPDMVVCGVNSAASQLQIFLADALNPYLASEIAVPLSSIRAAVCNPPFIRPRWRRQFAEVLEAAELSACYPAIEEAGAAVLFLAQNIRFLRTGGQVGLIVPDGVVSGLNHRKLRRALIDQHTITDVIELPSNAFTGAEVKTHILVLSKGTQVTDAVQVRRFERGGLTAARFVHLEGAIHRLDFSYYEQLGQTRRRRPPAQKPLLCLKDLNPELQRGRASTVDCAALPRHVFHTTDFPTTPAITIAGRWHWTRALGSRHGQILAWPGDILIGRVGRNLEQKVGMIKTGTVAITDCVYRLRVGARYRQAVINYLTSSRGRAVLASIASGSGARHLSKEELLNMPLWSIKP